jgi:hypothetical protein
VLFLFHEQCETPFATILRCTMLLQRLSLSSAIPNQASCNVKKLHEHEHNVWNHYVPSRWPLCPVRQRNLCQDKALLNSCVSLCPSRPRMPILTLALCLHDHDRIVHTLRSFDLAPCVETPSFSSDSFVESSISFHDKVCRFSAYLCKRNSCSHSWIVNAADWSGFFVCFVMAEECFESV